MMRRKIDPRAAMILAPLLALAGGPAVAADSATAPAPPSTPAFSVMGPSSCAKWPKAAKVTSSAKAAPLNWVLGFISGRAAENNLALLEMMDPEAVGAWMDSYCQANPTDNLPNAAVELERQLTAKLPSRQPPPAPPPSLPSASSSAAKAEDKKPAAPARAKPRPARPKAAPRKPSPRPPTSG